MLLRFHHLAVDHTGMEIIQQEAQAYLLGREQELSPPQPFRNFVAQARLGVSRQEHEAFFHQMLGDVHEPTAPYGVLQVHGDGSQVQEECQRLDSRLSRRIRWQARQLGVSAASLFHFTWAQVLGRTAAREDVVFGTVLFGRMHGGEGADRALGMFINTLPVRIRVGEVSVVEGIRHTHEILAQLMRHEHASLALAQRCSGVPGTVPLFSALLNYRHSVVRPAVVAEIEHSGMRVLSVQERTNYPCTLSVDDLGDEFALSLQVVPPLPGKRLSRYVQQGLEEVVQALEQAPLTPAWHIGVLDEMEREQLLVRWNATQREYPRESCIHELFEAQVQRTPEATAVVFEGRSLSYAELNAQSNRLAGYLKDLGVGPEVRVGICAQRGLEMVVAVLASLKAGGAYVPLDPAYPNERLMYMLQDSGAAVLLHAQLAAEVTLQLQEAAGPAVALVDLCADVARWASRSDRSLDRDCQGNDRDCQGSDPDCPGSGVSSQNLAYVIYTSGSTGQPKGVMVEHANVVRLFSATREWFQFDST
ncbi:MAG TPA: AMP-binding protein, partial [Flavobacteriales bacterium]|nr:AMP-binding protein [Flavobacteriales bacterium]